MGTAVPSDGALRIGGNAIWPEEGFNGLIDKVRVWPVALTPTEIAQTAVGGAAGKAAARTTAGRAKVKRAPACSKTSTKKHHRIVRKACKKKR